MKKFFALLFVCAGLTAMAAVPHVNNAKVAQGKAQTSMVLKSNTLANQMTAPAMKAGKNMSVQQFFAERNVTPSDNKLMKKAPARVSADDVMLTKIAFMVAYDYDADAGEMVQANNFYFGGWDVDLEQVDDNNFNAYVYFTGIPFEIAVDYDAKTAEMTTGYLAGFQWSDTTKSGQTTTICDTTEYLYLVDEAFMLSDDENADFANLQGTLYDDGSIYFPDGWLVYEMIYTVKRVTRYGNTTTTYDTVAARSDYYHSTYLMTANATHDYDYQGSGSTATHYNNNAYMFQYDDTTALVWNLWQFGNRGAEFYIYEDGSMVFPYGQIVGTGDVDDLEAAYSQYDWQTYGYWFINANADGDEEDVEGIVTPTTLEWDGTTWLRYCLYGGNTYALSYYPMLNNVLTFTGDDFFMLGVTEDPVINTEVTDDAVIITLELEEGAEYLMTVDGEYVESPYSLPRTDEDYTVTVMAIAQVYGKQMSNVVEAEVTVPALEIVWTRGDVDMDGSIGISDVTALIDYLLSGDATGISLEAANTDQDDSIGISDVTTLIDYLLNGYW